MNSEKYKTLLRENILRLKSDGDYLRQGNRNQMAIFTYITMTEEFFKLARYTDEKKIQRIKGHFAKLEEVNEVLQKRVNVFKSEDARQNISKGMFDTIHTSLDELVANTSDAIQRNSLIEFKKNISSPEMVSEVTTILNSGLENMSKQLERYYSNTTRELCLYVDWNQTPLDDKDIEILLNMYTEISDGIVTFMETMV